MRLDSSFLDFLMRAALAEASLAWARGEVPVGAVVAHGNKIIASASNRVEELQDCSAHAEVLAIRQASLKLDNWRLNESVLCVTLEPCSMCTGAIKLARIPTVIYGAGDSRAGAMGSLYDIAQDVRTGEAPRVVKGILELECAGILKGFFAERRKTAQQGIGSADSAPTQSHLV